MIDQCLCDDAVERQIELRSQQFSDELMGHHQHVLQWCSGKDLFASLSGAALQEAGVQSPQTLCNILRDWIRDNPDAFVGFFPEFTALKQQMSGTIPSQPEQLPTRPRRGIILED